MIAQFLASDETETSLLVKTGSRQEATKLQKYMSDQLYLQEGSLKQFNGALIDHWTIGKFYTICFEDDLEALEAAEQCIWNYVNRMNESYYDDEPSPFETYEAYVASDMEDILNERGIRGSGHNKYLDTLDKDLRIRKELRRFFEEHVDEEEAAERLINLMNKEDLNEDFSMGVSGPTGLNQGIPHGGPGKGCLPKPLYNPKAKAVPAKEKDDKDTEENLKKLRSAKKLLKNEGYVLERAVPEYFCRNPYTIEDMENYLHDEDGFEWDEVDCLIDNNREMIINKLEQGMSPERISADLDDSCLKDLEA